VKLSDSEEIQDAMQYCSTLYVLDLVDCTAVERGGGTAAEQRNTTGSSRALAGCEGVNMAMLCTPRTIGAIIGRKAPRTLQHPACWRGGLLLARSQSSGDGAWSAATVQETLNMHPMVADCVVDDAEHIHGIPGTLAHVVPVWNSVALVLPRGFTLGAKTFVEDPNKLEPDASPEYQVYLEEHCHVNEAMLNEYLVDEGFADDLHVPVVLLTETQLTEVRSVCPPTYMCTLCLTCTAYCIPVQPSVSAGGHPHT
jgi:hypothetical protein